MPEIAILIERTKLDFQSDIPSTSGIVFKWSCLVQKTRIETGVEHVKVADHIMKSNTKVFTSFRANHGQQRVVVFKPHIHERHGGTQIRNHRRSAGFHAP